MAKEPRKKVVSKKHLARIEREKIQQRYITIITVIVALVGLGVLFYILVYQPYIEKGLIQPGQPVAIVNKDKITTRTFQDRIRYIRLGLVSRAQQDYNLIQQFSDSPDFQQYFISDLQQLAYQLDPTYLGQTTLENMIEEKLIRQETKRRGITVSQEEIEKALQENYGYFANGTPTPTVTLPVQLSSTLSPTQLALVSPTPTASATPTITNTPTLEFTLTPTLTPEFTSTPTSTPAPTATEAVLPTATPYTFEAYQDLLDQQLEALKEIDYDIDKLKVIVESQLLRDKLMKEVTAGLVKEQDYVWARHILVADEAAAKQVIERLNNGENYGALAAELSTDATTKDNGGDLDWFYRHDITSKFGEAFAESAFNLGIGEVSQPVQSEDGWHVIQVLGHEIRRMTSVEFEDYLSQVFTDWLQKLRESATIETFDYWMDRVPTEPSLDPAILQALTGSQTTP